MAKITDTNILLSLVVDKEEFVLLLLSCLGNGLGGLFKENNVPMLKCHKIMAFMNHFYSKRENLTYL